MKTHTIIIFIFLMFISPVFAQEQRCSCLSASKKDVPSQGNVLVILNGGKVKQVKGVVSWGNGKGVMENSVIEVFKVSESEIDKKVSYNGYSNDPDIARDQKIYDIAQDKKRKTACRTGKNGKFCFKNLPKGMYILRLGLNRSVNSGMNEIYYVVEVDRKNGKNHEIEAFINAAG